MYKRIISVINMVSNHFHKMKHDLDIAIKKNNTPTIDLTFTEFKKITITDSYERDSKGKIHVRAVYGYMLHELIPPSDKSTICAVFDAYEDDIIDGLRNRINNTYAGAHVKFKVYDLSEQRTCIYITLWHNIDDGEYASSYRDIIGKMLINSYIEYETDYLRLLTLNKEHSIE